MGAMSMQLPRMVLRPSSTSDDMPSSAKVAWPASYIVSAMQALTIGYSATCDVVLPAGLSSESTTMDIVATLCYDAAYHTVVLYLTSIYIPVFVNTTRVLRQGLPVPLKPGWTLRFGVSALPSGQLPTPLSLAQCCYTLEWPPRPTVPPLQLAALVLPDTPPQETYKVQAASSSWDAEDGDMTAGELGTLLTLTSIKWAVMAATKGPPQLSLRDARTTPQVSESLSDRTNDDPTVVSTAFSVSHDAFSDKPAPTSRTTPSMMDEYDDEYTEDDATWESTPTFSAPPSGSTMDEKRDGATVGASGRSQRTRWQPVGVELFDSHGAIRGLWTPHMVSPAPWSSQAGQCPTLDSSWPEANIPAETRCTQVAISNAPLSTATTTTTTTTTTTQLRTRRDWLFMDIEPVCIVPYVLQRSYSHARLRPLMAVSDTISAPSSRQCGRNADGAVRRPALSCTTTTNVPPSGYATTATLRVFRRRRREDGAAGLCCGLQSAPMRAACRVLAVLESHYDAGSDAFLPFRAEQRGVLLDDFGLLTEVLVARLELVPSVMHLSAPLFCSGDVHGSYADVCTILDMAVPLRHWSLMTTPLLFLGDYVDRGAHSVQVVLLLFAWAVLCPRQLHLLRGNHEDPLVNGDEEVYGASCFRARCAQCLGPDAGDVFWRRSNEVFCHLPIAATIDGVIFACHGGVPLLRDGPPREDTDDTPSVDMMQDLLAQRHSQRHFRFDALATAATDGVDVARRRRLVRELLWNDPVPQATLHHSANVSRQDSHSLAAERHSNGSSTRNELAGHFRRNMYRGDNEGVIREFDAVALHDFLARFHFALLLRAHQQQRRGLRVAHHGRIITLFSCCDETGQVGCAGACYITAQDEIHLLSWHSHTGANHHHRQHNYSYCDREDVSGRTDDDVEDIVTDPPTRVPPCHRPRAQSGREAQEATHNDACSPTSPLRAEPVGRGGGMPRWKLLVQSSSARSAECCG